MSNPEEEFDWNFEGEKNKESLLTIVNEEIEEPSSVKYPEDFYFSKSNKTGKKSSDNFIIPIDSPEENSFIRKYLNVKNMLNSDSNMSSSKKSKE